MFLHPAYTRHSICSIVRSQSLTAISFPHGTVPRMRSSTDRPAVNDLLRPSLLAWRAKHIAARAAQVRRPVITTTKQTEPIRTPPH
jgi:hypothetical protein